MKISRKLFYLFTKDYFLKQLHPKTQYYNEYDREDKLKTVVKQTFEGFYHLSLSLFWFYFFRNEIWFPSVLGG
jgi:hypothetical protein